MKLFLSAKNKASIVRELMSFFLRNKWWWLTPMVLMLVLLGLLLVFAQSSAIGPFIYTLF